MARTEGSVFDCASSLTAMLSDWALLWSAAFRPCAQPAQCSSSPGIALATPSSPAISSPPSPRAVERLLLLPPVRVQAVPPPLLGRRGGDAGGDLRPQGLQPADDIVRAEPHPLEVAVELHRVAALPALPH